MLELTDADASSIRDEVFAAYEPVVLRGLVNDWPAVQAARASPTQLARYLAGFDNGSAVDAILMPPEARGQISYNDAMDGFNFVRNRLPVSRILEQLARYAQFDDPPAVAVQSALLDDCLPGFAAENRLAVLDPAIAPRIWIGNRVTVPAHFDESMNVACVVAGRRRFTLFPPEQVANLYVGPLDFAPTGAAMSMVRFVAPDFAKFPRFGQALAAARISELGPGDAIFIPTLWWHHVESLDSQLNVLVNYWWNGALGSVDRTASGMDCLIHALLNIRPMPDELRQAWAGLFDHYVFGANERDVDHIPEHRRGVLATPSPEAARRIRDLLIARLRR
ncbi:MAG TPA: cupin-like domain-containing protein [Steroidobacteraceae bacterium]|nr:cupin-like domain-containing protein [Steroidobacteraceae bacterium]